MAVDYTKMLITGIDIKRLFCLPELDFKSQISKTTGEVNESVFIAEYRFCKIKILNANSKAPIVLFTGSIHKLWNDMHGVFAPNHNVNKSYSGFNGNQFTLNDVIEVRLHLEKLFDCKASQMAFQNIEIGLNLILPYSPILFLKGLLYHRNRMFEFSHFGNNSLATHSYYIFKNYSKSYQYGISENILRVELKILKMDEFRRNAIDIITFQDINKNTLNKALKLLLKRFDEIVHFDYTIDKKKLSSRELKAIQNYSNPRYWINDLKPIHRHRHLKKLNVITDKYSRHLFENIRTEIDKKCVTIDYDFGNNTKSKINQKRVMVDRGLKNTKCVTVDYSSIESTITQTPPKKTIENEPQKDKVKSSICRVTGIDISTQKSGSQQG